MKEKELRLALVCYGGVSLAVYMHGVTKEFQKLVRASAVYHRSPDPSVRYDTSYDEYNRDLDRETDSERVYYDLLKEIGQELDLRVIIDVVAGASAGGINGVMLARALAHDLPLDAHRNMWLKKADITALIEEEVIGRKWSKVFLKPLFWDINDRWLKKLAPDREMRDKLSTFMRSRWFEPPFSGRLMTNMLMDAAHAMGEPRSKTASLLPLGHQLDLFVSVTDFYGYQQSIPLDDPPVVTEREHRHVLRFNYLNRAEGDPDSDFSNDRIPGLVFAARATSSFPGAFPPVQLNEIDRVLQERGEEWPHREDFVNRKFKVMIDLGHNPWTSSFIDGSVLNNKPFADAIGALANRQAFREVDRRIIYIDPDPESGELERGGAAPGFFQTIRSALSDIPRNEPVRDELSAINLISRQNHLYREVVSATRPHIERAISQIFVEGIPARPTAREIALLRETANTHAAKDAGYAYDGYVQMKVLSVLHWVSDTLVDLAPEIAHPAHRLTLTRSIEAWARARSIFPVEFAAQNNTDEASNAKSPWVSFLRGFDVNYRERRIRFVIRRLNELYETPAEHPSPIDSKGLDEFKRALYGWLERVRARGHCKFFAHELMEEVGHLLNTTECRPSPDQLSPFLDALRAQLSLVPLDAQLDDEFSILAMNYLPEAQRREIILAFVCFPLFDVLTFPLLRWQKADDIDTVLVARISPLESSTLQPNSGPTLLRGRELGHFGAFFSESAREHDYLWGRLHAAERLIDFVADSASPSLQKVQINRKEFKGRIFRTILEAEAKHLTQSQSLLAHLGERTEALLNRSAG
ncbi:MAG: patatin-like protein [Parvibaculum sp.]